LAAQLNIIQLLLGVLALAQGCSRLLKPLLPGNSTSTCSLVDTSVEFTLSQPVKWAATAARFLKQDKLFSSAAKLFITILIWFI
jgi:hypothetical protein